MRRDRPVQAPGDLLSGGFDVFSYAAWRDYLLVNMPAREALPWATAAATLLPAEEPMSEQAAPVLCDDITPVIEFVRARLGERYSAAPRGLTAGELAAAFPQETWMESIVSRYWAIVRYADAPYRAAEMTPETTARQAGYIHALSVAITTMADIWAGHLDKPEYDVRTGVWCVPGKSVQAGQ